VTIYLVSREGRASWFSEAKSSRGGYAEERIEKVRPSRLEHALETAPERAVFYLDADAYEGETLYEAIDLVHAAREHSVGVFDADGRIADPARLFFHGAFDYLGPRALAHGVTAERFLAASTYRSRLLDTDEDELRTEDEDHLDRMRDVSVVHVPEREPPKNEIRSGAGWDGVEVGTQYTFWMLYARLHDTDGRKARTSESQAARLDRAFQEHLATEVGPFGGRVWMWKRFGGLLLFPYDGRRCSPIVPIFRLRMNRVIASVERLRVSTSVSFRLALHLGNTEYRRPGETGDVVSEDVNFIFHLGAYKPEPNRIALTRAAMSHVPHGLQEFFVPEEAFEGREIYRLAPFSDLPAAENA
jgi:hypothetical protein